MTDVALIADVKCEICFKTKSRYDLVKCDECKKQVCLDMETKKSCLAVIGWFSNALCNVCVTTFCTSCYIIHHSRKCSTCNVENVCDTCSECSRCSMIKYEMRKLQNALPCLSINECLGLI